MFLKIYFLNQLFIRVTKIGHVLLTDQKDKYTYLNILLSHRTAVSYIYRYI
jgi:hypothetical protein